MIYHNISDDGYDGDDDDYNEVLICCIPTGDLKGVVGSIYDAHIAYFQLSFVRSL